MAALLYLFSLQILRLIQLRWGVLQVPFVKTGTVGVDIDILRYDSCNKKLYFVRTNVLAALSGSASLFNMVIQ